MDKTTALLIFIAVLLLVIAVLLGIGVAHLRKAPPPAPPIVAQVVRDTPIATVPWPQLKGSALVDESTANLIEEWKAERDAAPEGSPRRQAFDDRLRELGAA